MISLVVAQEWLIIVGEICENRPLNSFLNAIIIPHENNIKLIGDVDAAGSGYYSGWDRITLFNYYLSVNWLAPKIKHFANTLEFMI